MKKGYVFACNGKADIIQNDSPNLSEAARSEIHRYSIGDVFTVSDDKGRCMTYRKINDGLQLIAVHGM